MCKAVAACLFFEPHILLHVLRIKHDSFHTITCCANAFKDRSIAVLTRFLTSFKTTSCSRWVSFIWTCPVSVSDAAINNCCSHLQPVHSQRRRRWSPLWFQDVWFYWILNVRASALISFALKPLSHIYMRKQPALRRARVRVKCLASKDLCVCLFCAHTSDFNLNLLLTRNKPKNTKPKTNVLLVFVFVFISVPNLSSWVS